MALLRPCRKFAQAFGKSLITFQTDYNRGSYYIAHVQGYVTVAPKLNCLMESIEKSELRNNINAPHNLNPSPIVTVHFHVLQLFRNLKYGEICNDDLLRIIKNCESMDKNIPPNFIELSLLRCCHEISPSVSLSDRQNMTNLVWDLVKERLPQPSVQHYNALLSAYEKNDHKIDVKNFLAEMKVPPDSETYKNLLRCAAKRGDVESTLYVLSLMKEMGVPQNEETFNCLVEAYAMSGDLKSALSTLENMKDTRIEPNEQSWWNIARGYAVIGDMANMTKILQARLPSVKGIMEVVKCLCLSKNGRHITEVLKFLPAETEITDAAIVERINELALLGNADESFAIVDYFPADAPPGSETVYETFLKNLVIAKTFPEKVLKIMDHIAENKNYPSAIMDVCEAALKTGERELVMMLLEIMHDRKIDIRPHYYWPLFIDMSKKEGESAIFRTIKHMLCLNVTPDHDTLYYYVFPFMNMYDVVSTLKKLNMIGMPTSVFITPLVCYLLSQGNLEGGCYLLSRYKGMVEFSSVLQPLRIAYKINRNIKACAEIFRYAPPDKYYPEQFLLNLYGEVPSKKDAKSVVQFLEAFKSLGIPVMSFAETQQKEGSESDQKTQSLRNPLEMVKPINSIPHPRDMAIDELECHLIELKSKGMNTRGVLRKLIMQHCAQNNYARVMELKKEYIELGHLWTSGMYSSILQLSIRNNKPQEAQDLYKLLQKYYPGFHVDDAKVLQLVTMLIENKLLDEAITILGSAISRGGPISSKASWRLLNTLAHSENSEMTESFLDILVNAGFCKNTNSILGPLIRRHLLNNDLPSAVNEFRKLAKKHKCTPLRQELVHALLGAIKRNDSMKNEYRKMLEDIRKISTEIHGFHEDIDLLFGLARNSMHEELAEFGKSVRPSRRELAKGLQYVSHEEQQKILTLILDYCPNLEDSTKTMLYEHLMTLYSTSGDCNEAIKLWQKISKENPRLVSQTVIGNFANLLDNNNVPLPEDFDLNWRKKTVHKVR